jgi:hypothetical protein
VQRKPPVLSSLKGFTPLCRFRDISPSRGEIGGCKALINLARILRHPVATGQLHRGA